MKFSLTIYMFQLLDFHLHTQWEDDGWNVYLIIVSCRRRMLYLNARFSLTHYLIKLVNFCLLLFLELYIRFDAISSWLRSRWFSIDDLNLRYWPMGTKDLLTSELRIIVHNTVLQLTTQKNKHSFPIVEKSFLRTSTAICQKMLETGDEYASVKYSLTFTDTYYYNVQLIMNYF